MLRPEKRLGFEILPIKGRMTLIPVTPSSSSAQAEDPCGGAAWLRVLDVAGLPPARE